MSVFSVGSSDPDRPVGRTGQAAQSVYDALREQIINLELKPDTTLSRTQLTERFQVSQTPIREAMHQLEQDGLIRVFPQSRTCVTRIDVRQLHETQFLRLALEVEVVRRLAASPSPDLIKRIRGLVQMQTALLGDPDQMDMFSELDRAFHRTLVDGVGMGNIYLMVTRRLGHMARCQRLELPKKGRMETILTAHAAIIEAIEAGDVDGSAAAMREHLSGTIQRISGLQAEFPAYFTGGNL